MSEPLTATEIKCLKNAARTFGYRYLDEYLATFKKLKQRGFVYETVRAFYITDAGQAFLSTMETRDE
jgi:uncharacterized protein YjhX (UPF0386 family)